MRRSLLHLLRAFSTLLCIAALILWHRSYRLSDGVAWQLPDGSERQIVSYTGGLHIQQIHPQFLFTPAPSGHRKIKEPVPANANWQTRAGVFSNQVLWQRAGFVLLAGYTQTLTLSGSSAWGSSATLNTNYVGFSTASGSMPLTTSVNGSSLTVSGSGSLVFQMDSTQLLLVIPWWFIAALTALLPATSLLRAPIFIRNRRRRRLNLCTNCGYDLRSSADCCPECGHRRNQE